MMVFHCISSPSMIQFIHLEYRYYREILGKQKKMMMYSHAEMDRRHSEYNQQFSRKECRARQGATMKVSTYMSHTGLTYVLYSSETLSS